MTDSIIAANSGAAAHRRPVRVASSSPSRPTSVSGPKRRCSAALSPTACDACCARGADSTSSSIRTPYALALGRTRDVTRAHQIAERRPARLDSSRRRAARLGGADASDVRPDRRSTPIAARTAASKTVAKNEVLTNLDVLLLSTLTYLDEMSRAPRRPP